MTLKTKSMLNTITILNLKKHPSKCSRRPYVQVVGFVCWVHGDANSRNNKSLYVDSNL